MKKIFSNIPQKIAMLLIAIGVWYLVGLNDSSTSQKNFTIPLAQEGIAENQIVSGAPSHVDIVVAGPSKQIDRLKPESFSAFLDFNQVSGSYDRRIKVDFPQGLRLISTSPETAIGTVEQISEKEYVVEIVFETNLDGNSLLSARAEPNSILIKGRESVLATISKVIAIANPNTENLSEIDLKVVALNSDSQAISELVLNPQQIKLSIEKSPVLHPKVIEVLLERPTTENYILESYKLSNSALTIVGEKEKIADISLIKAKVDLDTQNLSEGTYNIRAVLELPSGIAAMEAPTVEVILSKLPEAKPEIEPEGENNDTTDTPIRGPDTPQDQQPDSGF